MFKYLGVFSPISPQFSLFTICVYFARVSLLFLIRDQALSPFFPRTQVWIQSLIVIHERRKKKHFVNLFRSHTQGCKPCIYTPVTPPKPTPKGQETEPKIMAKRSIVIGPVRNNCDGVTEVVTRRRERFYCESIHFVLRQIYMAPIDHVTER